MRKLMMTSAIVAATSFGAMAQTGAEMAPSAGAGGPAHETVPAFLAADFIGTTLYSVEPGAEDAARWASTDTFGPARDNWENVGAIGDMVVTQDGDIRGVLVDVGGFLGFGARTVMIDLDDITFVADADAADDPGAFFVVANLSRDQLEALPEWTEDMLHAGFAPRATDVTAPDAGAMPSDQAAAPAATPGNVPGSMPGDMPEGYVTVDAATPTAEQLLAASIYDAAGDSVGGVDDLILASDGAVSEMIVDVGGFLGIGSHTVALSADQAEILWNPEDDSVRIHLSMTRDQLEALPEYQG